MKIAVIGYTGSGKRAMTEYLKNKFYCATLLLDDVSFPEESEERGAELTKELVKSFQREHVSWVIEGNAFDIDFEERMEEADKIVIMKYDRIRSLLRTVREHSAKGRMIGSTLIKKILFESRADERKTYNYVMRKYPGKTVMIFNNMQLLMYRDLI